jgi:hypothetical protein
MYKITNYSRKQAKRLGVDIRLSKNTKKKIDVYKKNKLLCSVGNVNYNNYPTYMEKYSKHYGKKYGLAYAKSRRRLYRIRHSKDRKKGCGYYADKILW